MQILLLQRRCIHEVAEKLLQSEAELEVSDLKIKAKKKRGNEFEKWHKVCSINEIISASEEKRGRKSLTKTFRRRLMLSLFTILSAGR